MPGLTTHGLWISQPYLDWLTISGLSIIGQPYMDSGLYRSGLAPIGRSHPSRPYLGWPYLDRSYKGWPALSGPYLDRSYKRWPALSTPYRAGMVWYGTPYLGWPYLDRSFKRWSQPWVCQAGSLIVMGGRRRDSWQNSLFWNIRHFYIKIDLRLEDSSIWRSRTSGGFLITYQTTVSAKKNAPFFN